MESKINFVENINNFVSTIANGCDIREISANETSDYNKKLGVIYNQMSSLANEKRQEYKELLLNILLAFKEDEIKLVCGILFYTKLFDREKGIKILIDVAENSKDEKCRNEAIYHLPYVVAKRYN